MSQHLDGWSERCFFNLLTKAKRNNVEHMDGMFNCQIDAMHHIIFSFAVKLKKKKKSIK